MKCDLTEPVFGNRCASCQVAAWGSSTSRGAVPRAASSDNSTPRSVSNWDVGHANARVAARSIENRRTVVGYAPAEHGTGSRWQQRARDARGSSVEFVGIYDLNFELVMHEFCERQKNAFNTPYREIVSTRAYSAHYVPTSPAAVAATRSPRASAARPRRGRVRGRAA